MPRLSNPYGVGMAGADLIYEQKDCPCCTLRFQYRTPRAAPIEPVTCPDCVPHADPANHGAMLEDHAARAIEFAGKLRGTAERLGREIGAARDLHQEDRVKVASALEQRAKWRAIAEAVIEVHQEQPNGKCGCDKPYPCETIRAMRDTDEGLTLRLILGDQALKYSSSDPPAAH